MKADGTFTVFLIFAALGSLFSGDLNAKEKSPTIEKCTDPLPRTRSGCSWEMCECRTGNSLAHDSTLYSASSEKSKVLGKLKSGTRFKNRDLSVVTRSYGHASIQTPEGKTLHVQIASYLGEGHYELCGWGSEQDDLKVMQEAKTEDWANVVTAKGEKGWVLAKDIRTNEGDHCDFDPPAK